MKKKSELTFEDLMKDLKTRYKMWLFTKRRSLVKLKIFIDGWILSNRLNNRALPIEDVYVEKFNGFVLDKYGINLVDNGAFNRWYDVIGSNTKNEEETIAAFFELFDEFHQKFENGEYESARQ